MNSVHIILVSFISLNLEGHQCFPQRREFDPNRLMEQYMKMRTNEGVFGSFHPYDVKETVHQYFSLNKESAKKVEQQQVQNQETGQSKFDPNGESMFGGHQSSVWKFASLYDPNKNAHKYIAESTDVGSLGPNPETSESEKAKAQAQQGFNPDRLNSEIMGMIKKQHFTPGMLSGMAYESSKPGQGSQEASQSRYSMTGGGFDPNRLNQELMQGSEYNPSTTISETIRPTFKPDAVQQFGPTGSHFLANLTLPKGEYSLGENVTDVVPTNSSSSVGVFVFGSKTAPTTVSTLTGSSLRNATGPIVVSKNPSLSSGYHAVQAGGTGTGSAQNNNNTSGSVSVSGIGSLGPSGSTSMNSSAAQASGIGTLGGSNNAGSQNVQTGINGGRIQATGIGSLGVGHSGNIDQTGAFNSNPAHATGIGALGPSGSSNGSPVASGIGTLNGGGSGNSGNFHPGSMGLPGIQSSSIVSGGLPGLTGNNATGSVNAGSTGGSSAANFQNSVFASSKAQASGIGTLGGSLSQTGTSSGGNIASATGIGSLGFKNMTQTGVSNGNQLSQNGASVNAHASGIGSLNPTGK